MEIESDGQLNAAVRITSMVLPFSSPGTETEKELA